MTTTALLADLYRRGATVRVKAERLGINAPDGVLTADLRSAIAARKPELLKVVPITESYRKLALAAFNLLLEPDGPSDGAHAAFVEEQARYIDDLGPDLSAAVYLATGREWRNQTAVCPWCDDLGECHEPGGRTH